MNRPSDVSRLFRPSLANTLRPLLPGSLGCVVLGLLAFAPRILSEWAMWIYPQGWGSLETQFLKEGHPEFFLLELVKVLTATVSEGILNGPGWSWIVGASSAATLIYSFGRVVRFHPGLSPGYRNWLVQSGWAWPQSLPLGPVHPVWLDACVILVLSAGLIGLSPGMMVVPIASAVLGWTLGWLIPAGQAKGNWPGLFSLWCLLLIIGAVGKPLIMFAGLAAAAVLAWVATVRVLKQMGEGIAAPVPAEVYAEAYARMAEQIEEGYDTFSNGWPWQQLSPEALPRPNVLRRLSLLVTLWLTLVCGGSAWGYFFPGNRADRDLLKLLVLFVVFLMPMFWIWSRHGKTKPRRDLLPRLLSGRARAFIKRGLFWPMVARYAGVVLVLIVVGSLNLSVSIELGTMLVGALAVVLLPGPSANRWWLTGHATLVPGKVMKFQNSQQATATRGGGGQTRAAGVR